MESRPGGIPSVVRSGSPVRVIEEPAQHFVIVMKDGTIHKADYVTAAAFALHPPLPRLGERGMTSIASPASSTTAPAGTSTLSPAMARALLVLVTAVSVAAGLLATGTEASASATALAGGELTHLLRAMALLKVVMAAGMAAAVLWRFGSPVRLVWWAAYAVTCAGMAAGPGLIWQMAYVRSGALLLHAGLFAALILLWRDPAVGARLSTMVAARRAVLRAR